MFETNSLFPWPYPWANDCQAMNAGMATTHNGGQNIHFYDGHAKWFEMKHTINEGYENGTLPNPVAPRDPWGTYQWSYPPGSTPATGAF